MAQFITLSFEQATKESLALVNKKLATEWIAVEDALKRVLAEDILCVKNLPSFNNAAMDGFAIKYTDLGKKLLIQDTIYAGQNIQNENLKNGSCYKIMTGALAPNDIDTIVPFEDTVHYDESSVQLPTNTKKGNALRLKGEEQKTGSVIIQKGEIVNSRTISMLSSQGITHICVYKKISIAVFSTGDELKEPWDKAKEDEIYNINSSAISGLLKENGFEVTYCGVIPDNLEESTAYFSNMKKFDILVTSGGVSMGEADFVAEALKKNGFISSFHGINIKPGKPTMMGKMQDTIVCSMPGNPLAAYVNAYLFLLPLARKLQGATHYEHLKVLVYNKEEFKVKPGRVNIVLGKMENQEFFVNRKNKYGSGMITPLIESNALIITDESTDEVEKDSIVTAYLL
jgi:molybdopterin molybdotransferase